MKPPTHAHTHKPRHWPCCYICKVPVDPLTTRDGVGIGGLACPPCAATMKGAQQDKIDDFTRRAEAKGLVVTIEMDNMGRATLIAKPPEEKTDEEAPPAGEDAADALQGAKHRDGDHGGHEGPLGAPAAREGPGGVPGPAKGPEAAEAELEAEAEGAEPDSADP